MNEHRFAIVTQSLNRLPSRRNLVRGLAGVGLGLAAARLPDGVTAKRARGKLRKARPNAFGCLNVGKSCKHAAQCCSSICERKKCRPHHTGTCPAGRRPAACGGASNIACTTNAGKEGFCATTTGNAGFCVVGGECFACATDAECQAAENGKYGPNAACVRCAGECAADGGTACVGPDPIEIPI